MSNIIEYKELIAFHPGYYIAEMIEDMEISQAEFALRMGTTTKTLSKLVNGQANLSNDLAKKLSVMTGTSIEVWQNLQNAYDQKLIGIEKAKDFDAQAEVAKKIDYKYFMEVAGLAPAKDMHEKISNLCSFFHISDLRILLQPDFLVTFKSGTTMVVEKNIVNSRAWIQTAMNLAKDIDTNPYNAKKLKGYLPELRDMTVEDPEVSRKRMEDIFAECGVAFVLLPHLKNSDVNGAVKWVNEERVVLAMDDRALHTEKFHFSLFHGIKHVLQHKTKTTFVSCPKELMDVNEKLESEADEFAKRHLM